MRERERVRERERERQTQIHTNIHNLITVNRCMRAHMIQLLIIPEVSERNSLYALRH